jgi:hypothetical protein
MRTKVEEALHRAFAPNRINQKREFFQIEPAQPIAILRLLHVEDATKVVAAEPTNVEAAEMEAAEQYQVRTWRPNFNFEEMGIAEGQKLVLNKTGETVTVAGPKKVRLESGEEMCLSAATQRLLHADHPVAPMAYWSYSDRPLAEIYNQTHLEEA